MTQLGSTSNSAHPRNIALWKEAKGGPPTVITLEEGSSAVMLQLKLQEFEEWTADGRTDGGTTCYPSLNNVVQIKAKVSEHSGVVAKIVFALKWRCYEDSYGT